MISEVKLLVGQDINDYVVLPITLLANMSKLDLKVGKRATQLSWTKQDDAGVSWLELRHKKNATFAREPIDGLHLKRTTDRYGLRSFEWSRL
jgi:hypothetical protein